MGLLYHFFFLGGGGEAGVEGFLVFSTSTTPVHFKLIKYTTHHKYFQNKSKWYPRSCGVFNDVIIFREIYRNFEITFDVKNYFFILLLPFLKENLLDISNK